MYSVVIRYLHPLPHARHGECSAHPDSITLDPFQFLIPWPGTLHVHPDTDTHPLHAPTRHTRAHTPPVGARLPHTRQTDTRTHTLRLAMARKEDTPCSGGSVRQTRRRKDEWGLEPSRCGSAECCSLAFEGSCRARGPGEGRATWGYRPGGHRQQAAPQEID